MRTLPRIVLWSLVGGLLQSGLVGLGAQELSLEEAVRIAQSDSFKIKAAAQAVEIAAGGERVAKAELLPELSAMATFGEYDGDVFYTRFISPAALALLNPTAAGTDVGEFSGTTVGLLRLTQTVYTGGAHSAHVRASRLEQRIAEQDLAQQQIDLAFDVAKAYYGVLLAERAVEVARQSALRSEKTQETVEKLLAEEEALKVEALGAESKVALERHRLQESENDLRLARMALNRLLARPPEGELALAGNLDAEARQMDEEQAVRAALAEHPALIKNQLKVELADEMLKGARSHFKPKMRVAGFYSQLDNETLFEGDFYGIDAMISIPFFKDAASGAGAVAQATARKSLEESSLAEAKSSVALACRDAARRVEESYAAIGVARKALEYQREKYRITESAFREQLATPEDLLDESAALAEAELDLYGAHYQSRMREAELDKTTGRR